MARPRRALRRSASGCDENRDGLGAAKAYDSVSSQARAAEGMVIDDWPEEVPITAAEVDVLENFLGGLLDAFLRPRP